MIHVRIKIIQPSCRQVWDIIAATTLAAIEIAYGLAKPGEPFTLIAQPLHKGVI